MKKRFLVLAAFFGIGLAAAYLGSNKFASATTTSTSFLVPSSSSSTTTSNTNSYVYALSANGKYATVDTLSTNSILSQRFTSYLLNTSTGSAVKYVVSTSGVDGSPRTVDAGDAISQTGRYVAFISSDTNLIDGTTTSGTNAQLYLRDTNTNTTTLLSQTSAGQLANASIDGVNGVSSDGRFVLFATAATNLASHTTNGYDNFIMLDRSSGTFTNLSVDASGNDMPGNLYDPGNAVMSCDGSLVAFSYFGIPGGSSQAYLLDRRAGNTLTDLMTGLSDWADGVAPTISCNGNYVGFVTNAENVVAGQTNSANNYHAYVYDRVNGTYQLVDQSSSGVMANTSIASDTNSTCDVAHSGMMGTCVLVSDNGLTTFASDASNLGSGSSAYINAYTRNLNTGDTELMTPTANTSGNTYTPTGLSSNGKIIVFYSLANDLVSGGTDTNNANDAFLYQTGL